MKKVLLIATALLLVSLSASCSALKNAGKAISAAKSALAEASAQAGMATVAPAEGTDPALLSPPSSGKPTAAPKGKTAKGWPSDIPSCLPAFTYGVYQSDKTSRIESNGEVTYMMTFTGVTKEDVKAYAEELKRTTLSVSVTEAQGMYSVTAGKDMSGYYIIPVSAYWEEAVNTCSLVVSVNPKYLEY